MKTIKPLLSLAVLFVITAISSIASAADGIAVDPNATNFNAQNVKTVGLSGNFGWIALAAGLGIGLAALGGSIGQGRAAGAALSIPMRAISIRSRSLERAPRRRSSRSSRSRSSCSRSPP